MFDSTIHRRTIVRQFQASDFSAEPKLASEQYRQEVAAKAVEIANTGFVGIGLKKSILRGKAVFQLTNLPELLIVRHLTANIRRITGVKQDDRSYIVECVRRLLEEGIPFRVYKYDVKNFYESVLVEDILDKLGDDVAFSGQSVRALKSLFENLQFSGVIGLPRGVGISATLAEYLMRNFDYKISNLPGVWYYSRFVDDKIVITNIEASPETFNQDVKKELPSGLTFNQKSTDIVFKDFVKGNIGLREGGFDFLGYKFSVSLSYRNSSAKKIVRDVSVDLSEGKMKRLKTRFIKSTIKYNSGGSFEDYRDRVRILTGNFRFTDKKTGRSRVSGIYFNYPLIDIDQSESLPELDRFVRSIVSSRNPKNSLRPALSKAQAAEIMRLTFVQGFQERRFFHFKPSRLEALTSCWAYA